MNQFFALFISASVFICVPAYSDEVEDSIKEALNQYKEKDFSEASSSLDYASQLIRQKRGEQFTQFLPKALKGWQSNKSKSSSVGKAMFGGGITAERKYTKGKSRVNVSIVSDSPVMQGLITVFSNPMFMGGNGKKLTRVGGQKAMTSYNENSKRGEIQVLVDKRFLVTIKGSKVSQEDLQAYAKSIEYKKMKKL